MIMQSRKTARKNVKRKEHSVSELYLHGLAGVIGLGVLVIPVFISLVYGGPFSIYLVIAAGFIALLLAMLIYDISLTHNHDPYTFLKNSISKEYSFIFGFLLLISFLITITAAGIASVGELTQFFGMNLYMSIAVVDILFVIMWIVMFYKKTRASLNFAGALKILFVLLLIVIGVIALSAHGVRLTQTSFSFPSYVIAPFSFALLLFLWMYGGFEGASIVYRGENREKVAKAVILVIFTAIVIYSLVQLFVYETSSGISLTSLQLSSISVFTANVISTGFSLATQELVVGISIIVILSAAFAVINASNHTLSDMAKDGLMPKFLVKDDNLKLLVSVAVPIVLITIFSSIVVLGPGVFIYIPIIIISALAFAAAFTFFAFGYMHYYTRKKDNARILFGLFVGLLLLALIILTPAEFLIGLVIILVVSLIGYSLLK